MWKEIVVTYFKLLSQHFPGGTEEVMKNLSEDSQFSSQDSDLVSYEYKAGLLTTKTMVMKHFLGGGREVNISVILI
jgi:hypothetical protein